MLFYFQFKHRCTDGDGAMALEAAGDDREDIFPNGHLERIIVPSTLQ